MRHRLINPFCYLIVYSGKNTNCDVRAFFIGCAVMLVFAFILEGLAHKLILGSAAGAAIQGNVWLYALYGGFMAGLFEETGRLVAFKTVLKKYRGNDRNALMYGAGHGGFEAFYLLVVGLLNYFVYAVMLNSGSAAALLEGLDSDAAATLEGVFASIAAGPPATFLLSVVERGAAVLLQLSLSVLVWFAAKRGGRSMWLVCPRNTAPTSRWTDRRDPFRVYFSRNDNRSDNLGDGDTLRSACALGMEADGRPGERKWLSKTEPCCAR